MEAAVKGNVTAQCENLEKKHSTMKNKILPFLAAGFFPGMALAASPWNVGNCASFFQGTYSTDAEHKSAVTIDASAVNPPENANPPPSIERPDVDVEDPRLDGRYRTTRY